MLVRKTAGSCAATIDAQANTNAIAARPFNDAVLLELALQRYAIELARSIDPGQRWTWSRDP